MNFKENITKKEIMKYQKYFVAPKIIMEIYKDDDIIPKELVKMMFIREKPKPYKVTFYSQKLYDKFNKMLKEQYNDKKNNNIRF